QAEDGIRDLYVTGVQTCALPISRLEQGGVTRAVFDWCSVLAQRGHEVTLAHGDPSDVPGEWTGAPGLPRGIKIDLNASIRDQLRSEERRVGKEGRSRWSAYQ